jgi:S1-C subfamily serine protease
MMKGKSRTIIAVLVIANVGMLIAVGVYVLANMGIFDSGSGFLSGSSQSIQVEVRTPSTVMVGDTFEVFIAVENQSDDNLVVDQILLPQSLLEAVVVLDVFPGSLNQVTDDSLTGFVIDFILIPQEVREFRIRLQAINAIDFTGNFDVKAGSSRASTSTRVVINASADEVALEPAASVTETEAPQPASDIPFSSVVKITAMYMENGELTPGWSGSGSIISSDGLILTNAHVVLPDKFFPVDALKISLTGEPDQPPVDSYYAEVLQADWQLDVAVIRITTDMDKKEVDRSELKLPAVPLGESGQIQLGDSLIILGYPGIGGQTITLTRGEVSGFTSEETYGDRAFIKTSATIAGGNSGGLVVNATGYLVAIPTQLGYGGEDQYVDCRVIVDTNRDGVVDGRDSCIPTGGFINALRPIDLAMPLIEAAQRGEYNIVEQPQPEISMPQGKAIIYQEDFSSASSGWNHIRDEAAMVGYKNGEYEIQINWEGFYFWGNPDENFGDIVLTVDSRIITPVDNGDFGVICRAKDEGNFYAMTMMADGWFSIWKLEDYSIEWLWDWDYTREITQDGAFTITAACISSELTLAIDDIPVAQVTDYSFTNGDIGLIAGTYDEAGFTVAFDNLVVMHP